jgi:hypothetical protein
MIDARPLGVVVDTMVISWLLGERVNAAAEGNRALIDARAVLLAFQTVMELRSPRREARPPSIARQQTEGLYGQTRANVDATEPCLQVLVAPGSASLKRHLAMTTDHAGMPTAVERVMPVNVRESLIAERLVLP